MRSPIQAMLWEIWRVTRGEIAARLALGIVGSLIVLASCAALGYSNVGAAISLGVLVAPHFIGWPFLSRLNGGRFGFPLHLLYTRPVRTPVIVGLLMAYLIAVPSAIYLLSALVLRVTSGYPFPLLPVAAWIAALTMVYLATAWSTRSRFIQTQVGAIVSGTWVVLAMYRLTSVKVEGGDKWPPRLWPTLFDFPLSDYALIAVVGLATFGIAVAGVARQRRGDAPIARTPGAGFPVWLVNLFRFSCPTSSATRAQVWFELKSRGLPTLTIAVVIAIATPLLFASCVFIGAAFSGWFADVIAASLVGIACFSSVVAVMGLAPLNAFGIRWRRSGFLFEATQPYGSARLAALKVLVRSACMLTALVVVGVSLRATFALVPLEVSNRFGSKIHIAGVSLGSWLRLIEGAVAALSGSELFALAVVVAIGVVVWVTTLAVLFALLTRYSRRAGIAILLSLTFGLALALIALAGRNGIVSVSLVDTLFSATRWIAVVAMSLVTVYLFWNGFAERVLTVRYTSGALAVLAAFVAAWVAVLHAVGVEFAGMPAAHAVSMLLPALLPLMLSVLAPWTLNRIRHW